MHVSDIKLSLLQALYENGARKIVVFGVGPLGCIPNVLFRFQSPDGSCIEDPVNKLVRSFNSALQVSLQKLMEKYDGLYILYAETYKKIIEFTQNSSSYGMPSLFNDLVMVEFSSEHFQVLQSYSRGEGSLGCRCCTILSSGSDK
jgi:hypothetical protein